MCLCARDEERDGEGAGQGIEREEKREPILNIIQIRTTHFVQLSSLIFARRQGRAGVYYDFSCKTDI